jgi:alpha(1,3/1,4) fucosyltransferase
MQRKIVFYFLLISVFIFTNYAQNNKNQTVYIVPFAGYGPEELFQTCPPFARLREVIRSKGYKVQSTRLESTLTDCAAIIVCDLAKPDLLAHYKQAKKILILLEPPAVMPQYYQASYHAYFDTIFTMFDLMIDHKKYCKLYFPQNSLVYNGSPIDFNKKKLCTFIASNKSSKHEHELYTARKQIIYFFEKNYAQDFEFYGHMWEPHIYTTYKGTIGSKYEILKNFKFCIAYENMRNTRGYITEKIFDCFIMGCVPIYWGAENIADYIPPNCFISREDFKSDQELYNFLKSMSAEQYEHYQEAIKKFLESAQAQLFSIDYFVEQITAKLELS